MGTMCGAQTIQLRDIVLAPESHQTQLFSLFILNAELRLLVKAIVWPVVLGNCSLDLFLSYDLWHIDILIKNRILYQSCDDTFDGIMIMFRYKHSYGKYSHIAYITIFINNGSKDGFPQEFKIRIVTFFEHNQEVNLTNLSILRTNQGDPSLEPLDYYFN